MIYSNVRIVTIGPEGTVKDYSFNPPKEEQPTPEQGNTEQGTEQAADASERMATAAAESSASVTDPALILGQVNGRVYRYFPDDFDMTQVGPQDPDIDFKQEAALSEEVRLALRAQARAKFLKRDARKQIEAQVGDTMDVIADLGQLVEFAIIAVSALWAGKAGLVELDEPTIKNYGTRGAAVLNFVSGGDLILRSSFEDPAKMISTIMPRYSKVQAIVRDSYIEPLKRLGL